MGCWQSYRMVRVGRELKTVEKSEGSDRREGKTVEKSEGSDRREGKSVSVEEWDKGSLTEWCALQQRIHVADWPQGLRLAG
jgi:hypothetical protein